MSHIHKQNDLRHLPSKDYNVCCSIACGLKVLLPTGRSTGQLWGQTTQCCPGRMLSPRSRGCRERLEARGLLKKGCWGRASQGVHTSSCNHRWSPISLNLSWKYLKVYKVFQAICHTLNRFLNILDSLSRKRKELLCHMDVYFLNN